MNGVQALPSTRIPTLNPRNSSEFLFHLPLGAFGYSSGWADKPFSLNRQPDLAPRRLVRLEQVGIAYFVPFEKGDFDSHELREFPFFKKRLLSDGNRSPGPIGLSSGGGSAIVEWEGRTIKVKRCGLAERGFVKEPFSSYAMFEKDGHHFESSFAVKGGLMELSSALHECKTLAEIRREDLCAAYKPLGVAVVTELPDTHWPTEAIGAVIVEIASDLRVDELVCMAISPLMATLFESGVLSYDPESEYFDCQGLSVEAFVLQAQPTFEKLQLIGRSAGSAYRRLHNRGYLRGVGSSWFGNEVVDANGSISMVDLDGGFGKMTEFSVEIAERMRQIEVQQYLAESYTFLTEMRPAALSFLGASFVEAFREGYQADYHGIPSDLVAQVIDEHLAVWPIVSRGFHFPNDDLTGFACANP